MFQVWNKNILLQECAKLGWSSYIGAHYVS